MGGETDSSVAVWIPSAPACVQNQGQSDITEHCSHYVPEGFSALEELVIEQIETLQPTQLQIRLSLLATSLASILGHMQNKEKGTPVRVLALQ